MSRLTRRTYSASKFGKIVDTGMKVITNVCTITAGCRKYGQIGDRKVEYEFNSHQWFFADTGSYVRNWIETAA